jgi:hypothetical protein
MIIAMRQEHVLRAVLEVNLVFANTCRTVYVAKSSTSAALFYPYGNDVKPPGAASWLSKRWLIVTVMFKTYGGSPPHSRPIIEPMGIITHGLGGRCDNDESAWNC